MDLRADSGVIIPAYNAAPFIAETLVSLLRHVAKDRIAVIDDGSIDGTAACVESLGVACLRHERNQGKGSALMTGFAWAREKGRQWAVTMDCDGQHSAADLAAFWNAPLRPDTGAVIGRRRRSGSPMPPHRRWSNALTTWMISRLAHRNVHDAQSGFRMYRLDAVEKARLPRHGRFEWESQALVLLGRGGYSLAAADISTLYTGNGSHMRLFADSLRFLRMYWRLVWTH